MDWWVLDNIWWVEDIWLTHTPQQTWLEWRATFVLGSLPFYHKLVASVGRKKAAKVDLLCQQNHQWCQDKVLKAWKDDLCSFHLGEEAPTLLSCPYNNTSNGSTHENHPLLTRHLKSDSQIGDRTLWVWCGVLSLALLQRTSICWLHLGMYYPRRRA